MSYDAWNAYFDEYSAEPKDASQLQKYSKRTSNALEGLNYKQAKDQFSQCKGKGKMGGGGGGSNASETDNNNNNSKSSSGGGGGGNPLFASLQQGLSVTSGLNKVTADMKTKNRADRSGLVKMKPSKAKPKSKSSKTVKKVEPPVVRKQGSRLYVEFYTEGSLNLADEASFDVQTEVLVYKCVNFGLVVNAKVKTVQLLNCTKVQCQVAEVVSQIELVDCKRCTVFIEKNAPTVNIDKCQAPKLVIFAAALQTPPEIITANTSDMNVEIAGATEEDDFVTYSVPYQYKTIIDPQNRTFVTEAVSHMS